MGIAADVAAPASYMLSEKGPDGYDASNWECDGGYLDGNTISLKAGDVASCTITNDDTPPATGTITVIKDVTNNSGGTLEPVDFKLMIDGVTAEQNVKIDEPAGPHLITELERPGYQQTGITCVDLGAAGHPTVGQGGSVNLVAGQDVQCTVSNDDIAPTLTVVKHVNPDNGGVAAPGSFTLMIDNADVTQNVPHPVLVGSHLVTEEPFAGYRMVGIDCSDASGPVPYDANTGGVNLVLDQDVTCIVTNQHDPIDLAITKTVDSGTHVAGGAPFDYTITVDNLGSRDAEATDMTTVTDVLPDGLSFVDFPANCSASGQTLTCNIDPALLQVADAPVVLTLTVEAAPDAASGVYRNVAFVDTPDDPACVGGDCVPVCDGEVANNNVACADTEITRTATITIDKDDHGVSVHPGGLYSYDITVTNNGPSSLLSGMTMTDDLPAGLTLVSVSAISPWDCPLTDPVVCTFGAALAPGASAPTITINVQLAAGSLSDSVINVAQAAGVVTPGTVVTATDDETTPVVRVADVSIDKSASAATVKVGQPLDWTIVVKNMGPDTATAVHVSDVMPSAFTVGTAVTSQGSCVTTPSTITCDLGNMANGATATITVHTTAVTASATPVSNSASVSTSSSDPDPDNNHDSAAVPVAPVVASSPPTAPVSDVSAAEPQLPRTGTDSLGPLRLATMLLFGGLASLVVARRRRSTTA